MTEEMIERAIVKGFLKLTVILTVVYGAVYAAIMYGDRIVMSVRGRIARFREDRKRNGFSEINRTEED